jgi:CRP-like cAMP-binding protein
METAAMFCLNNGRNGGDRRSSLLEDWADDPLQSLRNQGRDPRQVRGSQENLKQHHSLNPQTDLTAPSVIAPVMNALSLPAASEFNQDGQPRPEQMLRFILQEKKEQRCSFENGRSFTSLKTPTMLKRARPPRRKKKNRRAFWVWLDSTLPIILPTQRVRRYWDLLILSFVVYNSISVPFEASFAFEKSALQKGIENIVDVLFALDVFYTFRTAYIDEQGMVVRDGLKIAKRYMATWFPIDLAASLPLEMIVLWFGVANANLTYLAMLKTPRLLRLGRLLRFLEKLKNANIFRIIRLMALMCLVAHWTACVWHLLIVHNPELDFSIRRAGLIDEYLSCFYGSFLLMVGDNVNPVNNVERIFCCVMLVLGANLYATIVGNMALLVSTLNATAARHQQRAETIQEAMRYLKVSPPLQNRVLEYYDFLQTYTHPGSDLAEYLRELPLPLRNDMSKELFAAHLERVELFHGVQNHFIQWLCGELQMQVYLSGEHIYHYDDMCSNLHICVKGKVAMVTPEGFLHSVYRAGEHFSADALITVQPRLHNALALSNSDIMTLGATALTKHMRKCADSSAAIRRNAINLLYGDAVRDSLPIEQQKPHMLVTTAKTVRSARYDGKEAASVPKYLDEGIAMHSRVSNEAGEEAGDLLVHAFEEEDAVVLHRMDRALKVLIAKVEQLEQLHQPTGEAIFAGQSSEQQLGDT